MTTELFSNLLQLIVVSISAILATKLALEKKTVFYVLTAGALDTFALGVLYWLSYQFFTEITPQIFYVADISWLASYLFFIALELSTTEPGAKGKWHISMVIPIALGIGFTIYFCQWGDILLNIAYMSALTVLGCLALRNLKFSSSHWKNLHIFMLLFMVTEYGLWLSSCFWISDTLTNPYFWFDFALTAEMGLLLPLIKKGERL